MNRNERRNDRHTRLAQRRVARRESRSYNRREPWTRLILGLSLVVFGAILWLDHLDRLDAYDYLQWWPLVFLAFGISFLLQRRWLAAIIDFFIGLAFLPDVSFLPQFHLSQALGLWPLLITAGGVTLIMQALRPVEKDARGAGAFRALTIMGGSSRTAAAENFVGGDAVVVMGSCNVNLSQAVLAREAVIDVVAFWGGIEIRVPRTWRVENQVTEILGGFSDRTVAPIGEDAPRLVIRGSSIMSGIEVKNPREAV
ncbi:MAG: DUF5668 domain-containing protein [Acidobacteriota bacterium]